MDGTRKYDTAIRRWEGVGPYYAMFPTRFADEVISRFTRAGDIVLDPFSGRGTAVFSAAHQGRFGIGIEINPVGWVYSRAKLAPASKQSVLRRLKEIAAFSSDTLLEVDALPEFFHRCYSRGVLSFLLAARENLRWRKSKTDATTMALLLVYLHGKMGSALSNQMRQTKSMAPDYAVRWWQERALVPPDLDPVAFMASRLEWRYSKGVPVLPMSEVLLGDSERELDRIGRKLEYQGRHVRLLFTSPPYFALTNYHYDQWLRLWLLGGPPSARRVSGDYESKGKFENANRYRCLLENVFQGAAPLLDRDSVVYVRTGAGAVTLDTTLAVMKAAFPGHLLHMQAQPYTKPTQTQLFGDGSLKAGEVDLIMTRN